MDIIYPPWTESPHLSYENPRNILLHLLILATMALTASEIRYEQAHITDNATTSIIAANVICFTVACCAISLRLVSRRLRRLQLGIDDYFAMLAMVRLVA